MKTTQKKIQSSVIFLFLFSGISLAQSTASNLAMKSDPIEVEKHCEMVASETMVKVYAHATKNHVVTIESPTVGKVKLYDEEGKLVHCQDVSSGSNEVKLLPLPQGNYILKLVDNQGASLKKTRLTYVKVD